MLEIVERLCTHVGIIVKGQLVEQAALETIRQGGTLEARMKNTPALGNARAKDGAMAGVRALCGLVNTADGEPLAFAMLVNNFAAPGTTVTAAIDAVVARLAGFRR